MPNLDDLIAEAANAHAIDPDTLRRIIEFESGGHAAAANGSYRGLMQLSQPEFEKYGGGGDINDPRANIMAGAAKLAAERTLFRDRYGRDPTPTELYMIHQQGWGGAQAHIDNPDRPAWQNMASTAEGRVRGPDWAKQAIWGNIPADLRAQFPQGVDSLTSRDFLNLWNRKMAGQGSFNDLMGQYLAQVAAMKQRYGAQGQTQAASPLPPVPLGANGASDPRVALLLAQLQNQPSLLHQPQPSQQQPLPYAQAGVHSYSPNTMNYLQMMLATQPQGSSGA